MKKTELFFLFIFMAYSLAYETHANTHANTHDFRFEVHCIEPLKKVYLKDLCASSDEEKSCPWQIVSQSKHASVWSNTKAGGLIVREIPNRQMLRITMKKIQDLKIPWCSSIAKVSFSEIPMATLSTLRKAKETLYLLPQKNNAQGKLLEAIDHPCRKLTKIKANSSYHFVFLLPSQKKSCQKTSTGKLNKEMKKKVTPK